MADYTITSANVDPNGNAGGQAPAGEVMDAGTFIYLDAAASNVAKKADATSQAKANVVGMTICPADKIGQPVVYVTTGELIVGAAMFAGVGRTLALSASAGAGKAAPVADLVATNWVTYLGYSTGTDRFMLNLVKTAKQYT